MKLILKGLDENGYAEVRLPQVLANVAKNILCKYYKRSSSLTVNPIIFIRVVGRRIKLRKAIDEVFDIIYSADVSETSTLPTLGQPEPFRKREDIITSKELFEILREATENDEEAHTILIRILYFITRSVIEDQILSSIRESPEQITINVSEGELGRLLRGRYKLQVDEKTLRLLAKIVKEDLPRLIEAIKKILNDDLREGVDYEIREIEDKYPYYEGVEIGLFFIPSVELNNEDIEYVKLLGLDRYYNHNADAIVIDVNDFMKMTTFSYIMHSPPTILAGDEELMECTS